MNVVVTLGAGILLVVLSACGGGDGGGKKAPSTQNAAGFFASPVKIDTSRFTNAATGDFNNDGREDLVVTFTGTDIDNDQDQTLNNGWSTVEIKIYLQNTSGVLEDKTSTLIDTIPSITLARFIEVADFNADGYDDIYFGNHGLEVGNNTSANWHETDVFLLSDGAGKYTDVMGTNIPTRNRQDINNTRDWYTHGVDSADIDGDGDIDLVINTLFGPGLMVLNNNGAGVFTLTQTLTQAELWIQLIKANNDIYPDLFVGNGDVDASHRILLNTGIGTFTTVGEIILPVPLLDGKIEEAHVADVNGDGREDLIIGNTNAAFTNHILQVLINDYDVNTRFVDETSTRFPDPVTFATNFNPRFFVRDFNNDNYEDLIIVKKLNIAPFTSTTGLYINSNFKFVRITALEGMPSIFVPIDLGNDNLVDFVAAGFIAGDNGTFVYRATRALTVN